jgi:hypothetical protein
VGLAVSFLVLGMLPLSAQVQVIPQVADGAGWSTTIVLVNKTVTAKSVSLNFHQATVNGVTAPWTPPFLENVSLTAISLAAGSALFLHTPGTAASLTQGWGELAAAEGVVGYAIFTAHAPGNPAQDATAPAVTAASRILVPFDNTSSLVSAVAVVNPNGAAETISVNLRISDGSTSTGTLPSLPANGQMTFLMPDQFPETRGKSGLAEFYVASGSFSIIGLRANPSGAFTSAPVYFQTGPPVISASGSNGGAGAGATQVQIIPQVADGNGWSTAIVLTNTTTADLQVTLNFKMADPGGGGATGLWNPPLQENVSLAGFSIPAGSALFLHTPGMAASLSQGWAELVADRGVEGYAIFTSRAPGKPAQDATAPAVSASSRILVPFDNSSNLVTAVAAVNPTGAAESMSVNIRTADGVTSSAAPGLPSQGQITFLMPAQFSGTAGKSGLAEFYVPSGTLSFIALRANPSGGITSAPVYFETGSPVITTSGGGGGTPGGDGGGDSGTNPTQTEIDSWVSRGSYTSGTISLTRATAYATTDSFGAGGATAVTTATKSDQFSAQFSRFGGADLGKVLRGEVPPGFPNLSPTPGSCVVYDITALTNPYPNLTSAGLDAGPQITSNGMNGVQSALRQSNQVSGFTYNATGVPNTYLDAGRYTLSGPGGVDVGAFSGTLDIVPDLVVGNNPDDFKVINRGGGITVRWTGGESSTVLTISGSSGSVNLQTGAVSGAAFVCIQNVSAGQFTVPANILSQLPASPVIGAGGFNIVTRGTFSVTARGKGARFTVPGLDLLTALNFWAWSFTPQYQ